MTPNPTRPATPFLAQQGETPAGISVTACHSSTYVHSQPGPQGYGIQGVGKGGRGGGGWLGRGRPQERRERRQTGPGRFARGRGRLTRCLFLIT